MMRSLVVRKREVPTGISTNVYLDDVQKFENLIFPRIENGKDQ